MAEKQDFGGLAQASDMSKLPLYGVTEPQYEELKQAQEQALTALEQRYAQPNWFKVAAGFAKPQLGGFLASLGSASEAMGENVEQQRAQQLPIAQMRAQLAQTNLLLSKNKEVSDEIAAWKELHPGQTPPAALIAKWQATAPHSPTVKSLIDQQTASQKQQEQTLQYVQRNEENLRQMKASGLISAEEYNQATLQNRQLLKGLMPPAPPFEKDNMNKPATGTSDTSVPPTAAVTEKAVTPEEPKEPPATINKKDLSSFKIKNSFVLPHNQPDALLTQQEKLENSAIVNASAAVEKEHASQYANLQRLNNPVTIGVVKGAIDGAEQAIRTNPELVNDVTNQVRKLGPLASAAQAGLSVNWGPMGATISFPVEAGAKGALSETQQNYQDSFVNNLATMSYYSLLARGIDPDKVGADKFRQLLLQETGISNGAKAIAHAVDLNKAHIEHGVNYYEAINKALPSALESKTPAPFYEIYRQHPLVKVENGVYEARLKKINQDWERMMKESRAAEKKKGKQ